jgi:hypothetical protein
MNRNESRKLYIKSSLEKLEKHSQQLPKILSDETEALQTDSVKSLPFRGLTEKRVETRNSVVRNSGVRRTQVRFRTSIMGKAEKRFGRFDKTGRNSKKRIDEKIVKKTFWNFFCHWGLCARGVFLVGWYFLFTNQENGSIKKARSPGVMAALYNP